jgi:hypothetical protein
MSKFRSHYSNGNMSVFLEKVFDEWFDKLISKGWDSEITVNNKTGERNYDDDDDANPLRRKLEMMSSNVDSFISSLQRWSDGLEDIVEAKEDYKTICLHLEELEKARNIITETFIYIFDMGPRQIYEDKRAYSLPHSPPRPQPPVLRIRKFKRRRMNYDLGSAE